MWFFLPSLCPLWWSVCWYRSPISKLDGFASHCWVLRFLYVFWIQSLLDMWFADIFFQSVVNHFPLSRKYLFLSHGQWPSVIFHFWLTNGHLPWLGFKDCLWPAPNPLAWAWVSVHSQKQNCHHPFISFVNNNLISILSHHCVWVTET